MQPNRTIQILQQTLDAGLRNKDRLRHEDVRLSKTSHLVAQQIRETILSSKFREASPPLSIKHLREQLRVANGTIREALRILEAEGLVTVRPGRKGGVFVRRPTHETITKQLALLLEFNNTSLASMLEARLLLEPLCARLAAQRADAADIEVLSESVARLEQRVQEQDPLGFIRENAEFHVAVAVATRNDILQIFMTTLRELIYVSTIPVSAREDSQSRTVQAHKDILAALQAHDADRAEFLMRAHLQAFEKSIPDERAWRDTRSGLLTMPIGELGLPSRI